MFPNVTDANRPVEKLSLNTRYEEIIAAAEDVGKTKQIADFEDHISSATLCRALPRWEIERLISSDTATSATYYQQIEGNSRIPDNNVWDRLRRIADSHFFGVLGKDIQFAALTTNNRWLANYGDGAVFFKSQMVSHRTSFIEKNTAYYVNPIDSSISFGAGCKAIWGNKNKLAVAKLGEKVIYGVNADYPTVLVSSGADSSQDNFIEGHFLGGYTIRSIAHIEVKQGSLSELGRRTLTSRAQDCAFTYSELPDANDAVVVLEDSK